LQWQFTFYLLIINLKNMSTQFTLRCPKCGNENCEFEDDTNAGICNDCDIAFAIRQKEDCDLEPSQIPF
jgi:hypothetical protein